MIWSLLLVGEVEEEGDDGDEGAGEGDEGERDALLVWE
jgi:hypothetical protein